MKRQELWSCLAVMCIWSAPVVAGDISVIEAKDRALLDDVFVFEKTRAGVSVVVPTVGNEDGYGVQVKGGRDVSRVQALPLTLKKVTDGKNRGQSGDVQTKEHTGGNGVVGIVGDNLNTAVTASVAEAGEDKAVVVATKPGKGLSGTGDKVTDTKSGETAQKMVVGANEEIKYVYPSKNERDVARVSLREGYNPAVYSQAGALQRHNAEVKGLGRNIADEEIFRAETEKWRSIIASCLDNRIEGLKLEKALLYHGNIYEAVVYLSQTFTEVNACYEAIGHDIIRRYYGDDMVRQMAFANKARAFYVGGTDVDFNPAFCGDNCSLGAMADAQLQKFADFRTYLGELLADRPYDAVIAEVPHIVDEGNYEYAVDYVPEKVVVERKETFRDGSWSGVPQYASVRDEGAEEIILLPDGATATVPAEEMMTTGDYVADDVYVLEGADGRYIRYRQ